MCKLLFAAGWASGASTRPQIDFVNIGTTGNATDSGDLTNSRAPESACASDLNGSDRCVWTQAIASGNYDDTLDYITVSTPGNATDFGNLEYHTRGSAGCDNEGVRGLIMGGVNDGGYTNMTRYVTIASTGDGTNFGDLQADVRGYVAGASNGSRGVCAGGYTGSAHSNVMEYYTIASTGQATDLGDLTEARNGLAGAAGD